MITQGLSGVSKMLGALVVVSAVNFFPNGSALAMEEDSYIASSDYLFVPKGFDDNDRVEVVLDGWVNSSCDQVQKPKVSVHPQQGVIEIEVKVLRAEMWCMPVLTRFTAVADLGVLPEGIYDVVTNNGWLVQRLMVDEASSGGPDDYRYAQIDEVMVDYAPDPSEPAEYADSKWSAVLFGQYRNSCERIEFVQVNDSGSTIEVLPVLIPEGEFCLPVQEKFEYRVFLPDLQQEGRYLLHVRSADGEAVNHVFSAFQ